MKNVRSVEYPSVPEEFEKESLIDREYGKLYNFHKIEKIQKDSSGRIKPGLKSDRKSKGKLRDHFEIGKLVLILAARLKKKDSLERLYKSNTEN